jgi:hypothetical protein
MTRTLLAAGVVAAIAVFLPDVSNAQSQAQCEQVRQAVATYGYSAARRHALANYGADAVKAGDRCLGKGHATKKSHRTRR